MEMSCQSSVDEDDKDADSEISAFTPLQEPERMAHQSSCTDLLNKPATHHKSGLDVLSNVEVLSSDDLGNGPSMHQASEAIEHNCISIEKDEEKSITTLKTVQEIDTAGIWNFDADSPDDSLDDFGSVSALNWAPHKEYMQFLWENHSDSPEEETKDQISPTDRQRRKRKMDMVVMVDPSEDLYPDMGSKSFDESSDIDGQVDTSPVRMSPKLFKPPSSPTGKLSKYPNGSATAIKEMLHKAPVRISHENSLNYRLSQIKEKPPSYPCSKCDLVFTKQEHLQRHLKSHIDSPGISQKPYTCAECGQSFKQSTALADHISTHQVKKTRRTEDIKGNKKKYNKKLFCPQCPFVTNFPNTFVQHAKTHEKEKRNFGCDRCSFKTLSHTELRKHECMKHTIVTGKKQLQSKDSKSFPCTLCSYKAFAEHVFHNHLVLRHQMTLKEYMEAQNNGKDTQSQGHKVTSHRVSTAQKEFTSNVTKQNQNFSKGTPDESTDISDLFSSKLQKGPKTLSTESKLDRSINVLLSRQSQGKTSPDKKESNNCSAKAQDSTIDNFDDYDSLEMLSSKVGDSPMSENGLKLNIENSYKKSQSKRKMSTPYRNTSDQDSCFILPKHLPSHKKVNLEEEFSDCEDKDFLQINESNDSSTLFESSLEKERKSIFYTYSRRMSMRGALQASKRLFDKIKTEDEEQSIPDIKEECIETEVFQETFESHQIPLGESLDDDLSELESGQKNCPYCPAMFESGVGLSNHIRGHLHRVGLSYNARHIVSAEQVASQDRKPRIRRKIAAFRRLRKAIQLESDSETVKGVHACPLCGDSFDNRTGQSNHIRGHLKKLGRTFSTKSKSPIILLRELMRDKKECQRALQILGKRRNHFHYGASPKLHTANRFTSSLTEFPKNNSFARVCSETKPLTASFSFDESEAENGHRETDLEVKNSLSGTTDLIGILKRRKCQEEARVKASSQVSRHVLKVSSNSELSSGSRVPSLPTSGSEKGEFNRKVCIHCNATFHSGVSLSNHLRAYAKRQSIALLEGTTIDCKAVRQRSRPGSKKKTPMLNQTPEEMYRLTCRFCDLVFQGPLSVQEDWIKHLQRHIMNTGVPHTGLGMVEVTPLITEPPLLKTDEDSSLAVTNVAS
ncbi:zinc finger protein 644a [Oryzias melastigma]|uniref:Zinc finger protein 644a n=1 Tax=Oryzias melastigma TaxID=30732 RepID=A0A3B3CA66_ORYME|nr:zinc finger protein 644a [Oryzias melastigma]